MENDVGPSSSQTEESVDDNKEPNAASSFNSEPETTKRDKSASVSSASSTPPASPVSSESTKVIVLLKAVGDAPILKQRLFSIDHNKPLSSIIQNTKHILRLRLEPGQNLFFFVNQAFAPSPDQLIRNLYECFGSGGKLILHYSTTVAWG